MENKDDIVDEAESLVDEGDAETFAAVCRKVNKTFKKDGPTVYARFVVTEILKGIEPGVPQDLEGMTSVIRRTCALPLMKLVNDKENANGKKD